MGLAWGIALPLLMALVLYAIFRPPEIVVNQLLAHWFGAQFEAWRTAWADAWHPPRWVVDCLPGGLWVFAATLAIHALTPGTPRTRYWAACVPLCVVEGIELLQYLHVTDGSFDPLDMVVGAILWLAAWLSLHRKGRREGVWAIRPAWRVGGFVLVYAIVYLSDRAPLP